jgi:hypothetical protein
MAVQYTRKHHATDADMLGKVGRAHAKVIKPAGQQLARVCGVVHGAAWVDHFKRPMARG